MAQWFTCSEQDSNPCTHTIVAPSITTIALRCLVIVINHNGINEPHDDYCYLSMCSHHYLHSGTCRVAASGGARKAGKGRGNAQRARVLLAAVVRSQPHCGKACCAERTKSRALSATHRGNADICCLGRGDSAGYEYHMVVMWFLILLMKPLSLSYGCLHKRPPILYR